MTVSTLCLDLVCILFIVSQCQCQSKIPPLKNGSCSAGYYKLRHDCVMCGSDSYTALPNNLKYCLRCTPCDWDAHEVEDITKTCTPTQNRVCVCKAGFYKNNGHCKPCPSCQNCTECLNCKENCTQQMTIKMTIKTTIKTTTVVCGIGNFSDGGQCQSCVESKCKKESCKSFCSPTTVETKGYSNPLLLVLLIIVTILGGLLCLLLIWFCRRRLLCRQAKIWHVGKHPKCQIQPADQPNDVISIPRAMERNGTSIKTLPVTSYPHNVLSGDLQSIMAPLIANGNPKMMQVLQKESWPAPVLYTVIREIPVTRWKEFLRLLSVSDDQMERIELEAGPSYLEKQYHMLRLWSQSSGAKMENIYSTLHYMNLSGCAQELQEKLEQLQASMKAHSS
ncbi:tumor necrosis factor receptor superfamily member 1A-like isoform X3 [Sinocyclocheilus grahami]|uniref:Tumor necrosis factor receptor superfamily member 1A-like n=1 Tax=Sinocyclocheilus grahami TaxID=75366 RepID=A0A672LWQ9_SINGR|nr:PREDICTED: tumor necrosis factor receptor superfamily member 1A-like isoform X3 [Sinocyclocheilus grahami]